MIDLIPRQAYDIDTSQMTPDDRLAVTFTEGEAVYLQVLETPEKRVYLIDPAFAPEALWVTAAQLFQSLLPKRLGWLNPPMSATTVRHDGKVRMTVVTAGCRVLQPRSAFTVWYYYPLKGDGTAKNYGGQIDSIRSVTCAEIRSVHA